NSGMLIPRVALTATNVAAPVTNPQGGTLENGTLVYNTATTTVNPLYDVAPGFYYWNVNRWVAIAGSAPMPTANAWELTGNAGTNPDTNFIGTTDNADLRFRTDGMPKFTIPASGVQ